MPFYGENSGFRRINKDLIYEVQEKYNGVKSTNIFGKKIALVLYVLKENERPNMLRNFHDFVKSNEEGKEPAKLVSMFIRIDSDHQHIPPPAKSDIMVAKQASSVDAIKNTTIPMHPIATAENVDLPIPEAGQYIWVDVIEHGNNVLYVYTSHINVHMVKQEGSESGSSGKKGDKVPSPAPKDPVVTTIKIPLEEFNAGRYVSSDKKGPSNSVKSKVKIIKDYKYVIYDASEAFGADRNASESVRVRTYKSISGIMLHQTAGCLGKTPSEESGLSEKHDGKNIPDAVFSWQSIPSHFGVRRNGSVVYMHGVNIAVGHGGVPSPWTIAIEFEANEEGVPVGVHKSPVYSGHGPYYISQPFTELTEAQIDSAHTTLLPFILSILRKNGGEVKYIIAHRQSDKERQSDPGHKIWKQIGLIWMAKLHASDFDNAVWYYLTNRNLQCRCSDGSGCYCLQVGYHIPREWDERSAYKWRDKRVNIYGEEINDMEEEVSSCYNKEDECYKKMNKDLEKFIATGKVVER